jgi:hypothetical protein
MPGRYLLDAQHVEVREPVCVGHDPTQIHASIGPATPLNVPSDELHV